MVMVVSACAGFAAANRLTGASVTRHPGAGISPYYRSCTVCPHSIATVVTHEHWGGPDV